MPTAANWYHAHVDAVSRGEGKSAVGLAAYMTGEDMKDERTGKWCTRNHPGEVLGWGTTAPRGAPAYLADDAQIAKAWNAVEASETRVNSHVANHWNLASSREFSEADHIAVASAMAQAITDRYGIMVTWAVHKPTDHGDDRNWHIHLGYNMRRIDENGFGDKAREITAKQTRVEETIWQRKMFAEVINDRLEQIGSAERVSHETYERQGVDRDPTKHLGNEQNQLELRGVTTMFGEENREIRERNAARMALRNEHAKAVSHEASVSAEIIYLSRGSKVADVTDAHANEQPRRISEAAAEMQAQETARRQEQMRDAFNKRNEEQAEEAREKARKGNTQAQPIADTVTVTNRQQHNADRSQIEREAGRNGDIADASARYSVALGNNYDMRDPYTSLARTAMAENAAFVKEQQELRKQEAAAKDPSARRDIELRRHVEFYEYMSRTENQIADMHDVTAQRMESSRGIVGRAKAEIYQEEADKLRTERAEHQVAREQPPEKTPARSRKAPDTDPPPPAPSPGERQNMARSLGELAQAVATGALYERDSKQADGAPTVQPGQQQQAQRGPAPSRAADEQQGAKDREPTVARAIENTDRNVEMTDAKADKLAKLEASQNRSREAAKQPSAGQDRGR